jgi:hypothetical protein
MKIPSTRPLTVGDGLNFLLLTKSNPTDSLGEVQVSKQIDAEKCDYDNNNNNNDMSLGPKVYTKDQLALRFALETRCYRLF